MSSVQHSKIRTVEYRFTIPNGGDMKDLGVAITWAKSEAEKYGIDTSYDDWARIVSDDDGSHIVFTISEKASLAVDMSVDG